MRIRNYLILLALVSYGFISEARPPQNLTDEQRSCVQQAAENLNTRPTREEMRTILDACGVEKPQGGLPPGLANLSDSDHACLQQQLGNPITRQQRPSREEVHAAFESCGIDPPQRGERRSGGFGQGRNRANNAAAFTR